MRTSPSRIPCLLFFALAASAACVHGQTAGGTSASPTPAIQTGGETAAKSAAEVWLGLVDDARYEDSWQATASIFQKIVAKDQWAKLATAGRGSLGKLVSRKFKDAKFTKIMPGAPDGQYVVIRYDTTFEKKATAVETVTPMLDQDGQWKVSGYFIR